MFHVKHSLPYPRADHVRQPYSIPTICPIEWASPTALPFYHRTPRLSRENLIKLNLDFSVRSCYNVSVERKGKSKAIAKKKIKKELTILQIYAIINL